MNKEYIPQPLDVDDIVLPKEVDMLVEAMAKNVHEVWASGRMREGWNYGSKRNDSLKQHPSLVPYEELTYEEQEYDRATAVATLKFIYSQGFEIVPSDSKTLL